MLSFFSNIRNAAILAFIGTVTALAIPLWNALQSTFETWSTPTLQPWRVPVVVLLFLFSIVQPLFCYALYRNRGQLDISNELRSVSLIAAIGFGLIICAGLLQYVESFNSYRTAMSTERILEGHGHTAGPFAGASTLALNLLSDLSNLGYLALLIALSRKNDNRDDSGSPPSRLLRIVTKIAVVALGIGVALALIRIPGAVYAHFSLREQASQNGVTLPPLLPRILKFSQEALSQACLFAAPWVVYKSQSRLDVNKRLPVPRGHSELDGEQS